MRGAFDSHVRGMRLISECENAISELEREGQNVDTFRRVLHSWAAALMNFPQSWNGRDTNPRQVFTPRVMDTLETFALVLESRAPAINPYGIERLQSLLVEIQDLLKEDASLGGEMRLHVYEVVQMLLRYIEDKEMYGHADFRNAVKDLWIAVNAAAGASDDEHRSRWKDKANAILVPAAGTILGSIPAYGMQIAQIAGS